MMRKIIFFIYVVLTCIPVFAQSFYISELFANKSGRHSHTPNFFMELHNISSHRILVSRVLLEITSGKEQDIFREEITLKKAVPFDDRLVLGQEPDLGLGLCLESDIAFILLPAFNLEKNKNHKICLTINNSERDCAMFKDEYRSKNGAAIYRNYDGFKIQPFWLFESCLLTNNIFATPGYEPQACLTRDLSSLIFGPCEENLASINNIQEKVLFLNEALPPKITLSASGRIRIEDENESDLWRVSQCVGPKDINNICHEVGEPQSVKKRHDENIAETNWPLELGPTLSYKVRDIYGLSDIIKAKESVKKRSIKDLLVTTEKINAQNLIIKFQLLASDVPVNYWVKDREGQIIAAGAFINKGEKEVPVNLAQVSDLALELQSLYENRTINIKLESPEGCQTGMGQISLWMCAFLLFLYVLIRKYKKYIIKVM